MRDGIWKLPFEPSRTGVWKPAFRKNMDEQINEKNNDQIPKKLREKLAKKNLDRRTENFGRKDAWTDGKKSDGRTEKFWTDGRTGGRTKTTKKIKVCLKR